MAKKIILIILLLSIVIFLWRKRSVTPISENSLCIERQNFNNLENKLNICINKTAELQKLFDRDLPDYIQLKSLKEKYMKADELLGKVFLLFLTNLGAKLRPQITHTWATQNQESRSKEAMLLTDRSDPPCSQNLQDQSDTYTSTEKNINGKENIGAIKRFQSETISLNWYKTGRVGKGYIDRRRHQEFMWPISMLTEKEIPLKNFEEIRKPYAGDYGGVFFTADAKEYLIDYSLKKIPRTKNEAALAITISSNKIDILSISSTQRIFTPMQNFAYGGYLPLVFDSGQKYKINLFRYHDRRDIYGVIFTYTDVSSVVFGRFIISPYSFYKNQ